MIRTAWVAFVAFFATIWYGSDILLHAALGSRKAPCKCRERPRTWARRLLRAAGVRVVVEGGEHLEEGEGSILVANHVSWADVFALTAFLPVTYRFVAKKELANIPFFGQSWRVCGHIAIDRSDREAAIRSLDEAARQIREEDATIIVFPEGTRSQDGRLGPFKQGAFMLALQSGVPVVPCGILGSRDVMPKGSWRIRSGTIHVRIGEPIHVQGMSHQDRHRLRETARDRVSRLIGERSDGRTRADAGRSERRVDR